MTKAEAIAVALPGQNITFTTWPHRTAVDKGTAKSADWNALVAALCAPGESESKSECKMIKLATFSHGCKADDMERVYGIEGDYDGETVSIDDAAARLVAAGVKAFLYTSGSHGVHNPPKSHGGPRWRVIAPLSRAHTPAERAGVVALLNGALGGILAAESWTPAQRFFYGKVHGVAYETRGVAGVCIDTLDLLITPIGKPLAAAGKGDARPPGQVDDLERLVRLSEADLNTIDDLRSALPHIPAVSGFWYSTINMLASLKETALADAAFELADEFSQRFDDYDLDELAQIWDRTNPTKITYKSIFETAQKNGWINPRKGVSPPQLATAESVIEVVATTGRRFPRQSIEEITNRPVPAWRVKGLIPSTGVAMIYGASTSGKSFFALDLGMDIARGEAWRGHTTKQGAVVYVCAEGADDFAKRVTAYTKHHNTGALPFEVIDAAPNLMVKADVEALTAELMRAPVGIMFLDTLACMSVGGDENTAKDMAILIDHCKLISRMTGALVVLVHHTGKDESKGARGSSSLYGAMDTVIEISRAGDVRTAKVTKQKGGPDGQEFGFKLLTVSVGVDEDGDDISSCVVEHTAAMPQSERKQEVKGVNQRIVLRTLQKAFELTAEGMSTNDLAEAAAGELSHNPNSTRDTRKQKCMGAIDSLLAANRIAKEGGLLIPT